MPTVRASRVIVAPLETVWTTIRDFGAHSTWIEHHPVISLEGGNGLTIGFKRRVLYASGDFFDEILTGMDDRGAVRLIATCLRLAHVGQKWPTSGSNILPLG